MNPTLVTFPDFVWPTFWTKKISVGCRHAGMPARHEKLNFRNFRQTPLYDTSLQNSDLVEHNGEKIIKIGQFLTDLWTFEVG